MSPEELAPTNQQQLQWSKLPSDQAKALVRIDRNPLCVLGWGVLLLFLKFFFRTYGRLTFRGVENLPLKGPYMITPNHVSLADAFSLISAMPFGIGKQVFGLGDTKFFGGPVTSRLAKWSQVIPVDMDTKLFNALQLSSYVLRQGKVLYITPDTPRKAHEGVPVTIFGNWSPAALFARVLPSDGPALAGAALGLARVVGLAVCGRLDGAGLV